MNIRRTQPGDYRVLRGEIDKLQEEHAELNRHQETTTTTLKDELAKDAQWFDETAVLAQRRILARIDQRQRLLVDRIAALEGRLPTPTQRQDAERNTVIVVVRKHWMAKKCPA